MPNGLDAVISCLLAKSPQQRYRSARELEADLVRLSAGQPLDFYSAQMIAQARMDAHDDQAAPAALQPPTPTGRMPN